MDEGFWSTAREDAIWLECQQREAEQGKRDAERVIVAIDRILVKRIVQEISAEDALNQIGDLVSAWTDPKEPTT